MKQFAKYLFGIGLFFCTCFNSYAQEDETFIKVFITINNSNYEPTVQAITNEGGVTVSFTQSALNTITANYTFHQFHRAFPNTSDVTLENVFLIEVSSIQYMFDLLAYDSTVFSNGNVASFQKYYITIADSDYVPTYTYYNYISTLTFAQSSLNTLAADYTFEGFEKAFPNSTDPAQSDIYVLSVNSSDFPTELHNTLGTVFTSVDVYSPARFCVYITDSSKFFSISMAKGKVVPTISISMRPGIQAIFNKYNIFNFHKSYPKSNYEYLRNSFFIECNSIQLMNDLKNYDSVLFAQGHEMASTQPLYAPNDYGKVFSNTSKHLDLINAKSAWDITTGSSNVNIGISDWYCNVNHEDFKNGSTSKIAKIFRNNTSDLYSQTGIPVPAYYAHGTVSAGLAAGYTDNNKGLASVGFNCKLGIYSHLDAAVDGNDHVLEMSNDGYKIVNVSWSYELPCRGANDDISHNSFYGIGKLGNGTGTDIEGVYNEVYQNGTSVVCAAGNGGTVSIGSLSWDNSSFTFPSSFNHNISVTSVGSAISQANAVNGSFSVEDEHEKNRNSTPLHSGSTHHHNKLVDICAPGYTVDGFDYDPGVSSKLYKASYAGTSVAAPLVSGTLGLMLSVNDKLTPYQREYLLKTTADSGIYNLTANQKYDNPKLLGTGRLDVAAAVTASLPSNFNVNNPPSGTETMFIEEIKLNHRCLKTSIGAPTLTPVIKNGNGNYEYRWVSIYNNSTNLSNVYTANPSISYNTLTHDVLYYSLTVKELGKAIPRVATKVIKAINQCNPDLAIRDHFDDWYSEPNDMDIVDKRDKDYWNSPDIWNSSTSTGTVHQDPEYSATVPNYLRVKVRQVGAGLSDASRYQLKIYWTIASTGEKWPGDWTTNTMSGPNGTVPTGGELTATLTPQMINSMYGGQEQIITIEWFPPNPANYVSGSGKKVGICILARLLDLNATSNYGLDEQTFPTSGHLLYNLRQNNEIASKNMIVTDYVANKRTSTHLILFGNATNAAGTFSLKLLKERDIYPYLSGDLSEYLTCVLHLGNLYDLWANAGSLGNPSDVDETNKTVTYNLSEPMHLDSLHIDSNTLYPIEVELKLKDDIEVPLAIENSLIHLRQIHYTVPEGQESPEEIIDGSVSFSVNIGEIIDTSGNKSGINEKFDTPFERIGVKNKYIKVYPNPADNVATFDYNFPTASSKLSLSIVNVLGQKVNEIKLPTNQGKEIWDTRSVPTGVYIFKVYEGAKIVETGRLVISR